MYIVFLKKFFISMHHLDMHFVGFTHCLTLKHAMTLIHYGFITSHKTCMVRQKIAEINLQITLGFTRISNAKDAIIKMESAHQFQSKSIV